MMAEAKKPVAIDSRFDPVRLWVAFAIPPLPMVTEGAENPLVRSSH